MHCHLKLIIPPTNDVEKAVSEAMAPFDENESENHNTFWDYYTIGGRFADASGMIAGDVCRLGDSLDTTCYAVMVTGPSFGDKTYDGPQEAVFLIHQEIWNGVMHVESKWDGTLQSALKMHLERVKRYRPEYAAVVTPNDDWLCVTIDYHL